MGLRASCDGRMLNAMLEHLLPADLAELRALLQDEAEALRARLPQAQTTSSPNADEPQDMEDRAASEAAMQRGYHMVVRDRQRLHEVEAALARMDNGTYGLCEDTGEPIPLARLRSEPTARLTAQALEDREDDAAQDEAVTSRRTTDGY